MVRSELIKIIASKFPQLTVADVNASVATIIDGMIDSLAKGEAEKQDYAEALKGYKLSAEQGYASAQFSLGSMYANGLGVTQDYVRAVKWLNLAVISGDSVAVKNRDILAKKMTQQQLAEAQKLARECLAREYKGC